MPAEFERVDRNTRCTQQNMTDLQGRANTSTVTGKPYNFSSTGTWKTELVRLRENCLKKLQIFTINANEEPYITNFPYRKEAIVSGPWPFYLIGNNNTFPLTRFFSRFSNSPNVFTIGSGVEFNDVEYIAPNSGTMTLDILLAQFAPVAFPYYQRFYKELYEAGDFNHPDATFEVDLRTGGLSGRLTGALTFNFTGAITAAQFDLYGSGGVAGVEGYNTRTITVNLDIVIADGVFTCGLHRKSGAPTFEPASAVSFSRAKNTVWSHTISTPEAFGGIHNSNSVYKLAMPPIMTGSQEFNFGAYVPGTPVGGLKTETSFGFNTFKWYGNQSLIRCTPSANIATTGIWKAKSIPHNGGLYQGNFNPHAGAATIPTEEIPAISTATEYQIPAYHWAKDTDQNAGDLIVAGQAAGYGWAINEVYIVRNPVVNGDYYFPDTDQDVEVDIGCMRNGEFALFETVTLEAGQADAYIYPFWPIFTRHRLVYRCAHPMQIYARVISTTSGTNPAQGRGAAINLPILSDHYNDTMAMLEAIVDLGI